MLGDPDTLVHWDRPLTHEEAGVDRPQQGALRGRRLRPVGRVIEDEWEVELGYHFARRHWGNGYATEAVAACLEFARKRGIDRVVALILPENDRSIRVAERVGMTPGRAVEHAGRPHMLWETTPRFAS
jgi:RimJ/RimL family protein N-acetyltransferase